MMDVSCDGDAYDRLFATTAHPDRPISVSALGRLLVPGENVTDNQTYLANFAVGVSKPIGDLMPPGSRQITISFTIVLYGVECNCCRSDTCIGPGGVGYGSEYEYKVKASVTVQPAPSPSAGSSGGSSGGSCSGCPGSGSPPAPGTAPIEQMAKYSMGIGTYGPEWFWTQPRRVFAGQLSAVGQLESCWDLRFGPSLSLLVGWGGWGGNTYTHFGLIQDDGFPYGYTGAGSHTLTLRDRVTGDQYELYGELLDGETRPADYYNAWLGRHLRLKHHRRLVDPAGNGGNGSFEDVFAGVWDQGRVLYQYDPLDTNGATLAYQYSGTGQVTGLKAGPTLATAETFLTLGYDAAGRVTYQQRGCSSCSQRTRYYEYDSQDRVTLVKEPSAANPENLVNRQRNHLDYAMALPQVTKVTDGPAGSEIDRWRYDYSYDYTQQTYQSLQLTRRLFHDNNSARVQVEHYSTQAMASPTRVVAYTGLDGGGSACATSYGYGPTTNYVVSPRGISHIAHLNVDTTSPGYGRVTKRTMTDGTNTPITTEEYHYENVTYGGSPTLTLPALAYTIDARGVTNRYYYTSTTGSQYGTSGLLTRQVVCPASGPQTTREYRYDVRRRVTMEWSHDAAATWGSSAYAYNHRDNLTRRIEGAGSPQAMTTMYEYDTFNRQIKSIDPEGHIQQSGYSLDGSLSWSASMADATHALSETDYEYDVNGRMTLQKVAAATEAFVLGFPPAWIATRYSYDALGRRTAVVEDDGNGGLNLTTTYKYNNQDEVTWTFTPGNVWTKTERDGRGLVVRQVVGYGLNQQNPQADPPEPEDALVTTYEYDADGNMTRTVAPSQVQTRYEYDGYGRRVKMIRG